MDGTLNDGELHGMAFRVREHVVRMASEGGAFVGASLSSSLLLTYLYSRVLNLSPERPRDPSRDYVFLSSIRDLPALYGTLVERGFLQRENLARRIAQDDRFHGCPNQATPGVECHAGSLSDTFAVALGVSLGLTLEGSPNRVYVLLGDEERELSRTWECVRLAAERKLENLVVVIERNVESTRSEQDDLGQIVRKWKRCGWSVTHCEGDDLPSLSRAFAPSPKNDGCPRVVIANTLRPSYLFATSAEDRLTLSASDEIQRFLEQLRVDARADHISSCRVVA